MEHDKVHFLVKEKIPSFTGHEQIQLLALALDCWSRELIAKCLLHK